MDERQTPVRTGVTVGGMTPDDNDFGRSSKWLLVFPISLGGLVHLIIALTCRFQFNWRIDDTMIFEETLGLLGATITLFLLLRKQQAVGPIIAAYWAGFCVGLVFAMIAHASSSGRVPEMVLWNVIMDLAAFYCCPIAVGIAIIVGLRANRSSNVRIQKAI